MDSKKVEERFGLDPSELLLADLEHFGEMIWRNEEVGERRFNFFVTLTTAVGAGLVALFTAEHKVTENETLRAIVETAIAALFAFGLLTYLRIIQRNRVTDEYQRTARYIRAIYVRACPQLQEYEVPRTEKTWAGKWLKAGYAESIGLIEGIIATVFLVQFFGWAPMYAVALGFGLTAVLWVYAAVGRKKR